MITIQERIKAKVVLFDAIMELGIDSVRGREVDLLLDNIPELKDSEEAKMCLEQINYKGV